MTGAAQKISAVAAAIVFCLGFLVSPYLNSAFAQNEAEPEDTPMEAPQAEPTEWVPITAGDAARGAPAPTPEAAPSPGSEGVPVQATPAESASPAEEPSPAQSSSTSPAAVETPAITPPRSTISREPPPRSSRAGRKESSESAAPAPNAASSIGAMPPQAHKASKAAGPQIVPENSPFAGMNFGNQKGPTNIKSDSLNLDYQNKAIIFTGRVHAVQAGGDLTSNTLKVQYGQDFNDIKMMYADGDVRMSQGTRWITSDHAVLDQTKHLLRFLGNPVVHDGEDQITGSVIVVDLVTGKSTVENPRVVIFPRESKNPDNGTASDSP